MEKLKGTFITSVANKDGFIETDKKIIAIAGKSNVGKSSLINFIAGQKKLARTSVTPGRTRLVNYFDFGDFILADLPGYGFANVSKAEKQKWAELMEDFFNLTEIDHVFSLVDIRHSPTADDKNMINFLYAKTIPFTVVATKADKLGKTRIKPQVTALANELKMTANDVIATSSESGYGGDALIEKIKEIIKQGS